MALNNLRNKAQKDHDIYWMHDRPAPKFCKTIGTDDKESAGFFCGVFWGVVVSVPIWALLYWIFIW